MRKRGFTIIEMVVTLVVGGILIVALVCNFALLVRFQLLLNDQLMVIREARYVMHQMAMPFRFITDVAHYKPPSGRGEGGMGPTPFIQFFVEAGHVPVFGGRGDNIIPMRYVYPSSPNTVWYVSPGGTYSGVLTSNVMYFNGPENAPFTDPIWTNPYVTLKMIFIRNNQVLPIETRIRSVIK